MRFRAPSSAEEEGEVEGPAVIPEPYVAKTMLTQSAGIGRLPDFHARDAIADGRLARLLRNHETETVDAHALYPSHRSLSAKVRVFVDALSAQLKQA